MAGSVNLETLLEQLFTHINNGALSNPTEEEIMPFRNLTRTLVENCLILPKADINDSKLKAKLKQAETTLNLIKFVLTSVPDVFCSDGNGPEPGISSTEAQHRANDLIALSQLYVTSKAPGSSESEMISQEATPRFDMWLYVRLFDILRSTKFQMIQQQTVEVIHALCVAIRDRGETTKYENMISHFLKLLSAANDLLQTPNGFPATVNTLPSPNPNSGSPTNQNSAFSTVSLQNSAQCSVLAVNVLRLLTCCGKEDPPQMLRIAAEAWSLTKKMSERPWNEANRTSIESILQLWHTIYTGLLFLPPAISKDFVVTLCFCVLSSLKHRGSKDKDFEAETREDIVFADSLLALTGDAEQHFVPCKDVDIIAASTLVHELCTEPCFSLIQHARLKNTLLKVLGRINRLTRPPSTYDTIRFLLDCAANEELHKEAAECLVIIATSEFVPAMDPLSTALSQPKPRHMSRFAETLKRKERGDESQAPLEISSKRLKASAHRSLSVGEIIHEFVEDGLPDTLGPVRIAMQATFLMLAQLHNTPLSNLDGLGNLSRRADSLFKMLETHPEILPELETSISEFVTQTLNGVANLRVNSVEVNHLILVSAKLAIFLERQGSTTQRERLTFLLVLPWIVEIAATDKISAERTLVGEDVMEVIENMAKAANLQSHLSEANMDVDADVKSLAAAGGGIFGFIAPEVKAESLSALIILAQKNVALQGCVTQCFCLSFGQNSPSSLREKCWTILPTLLLLVRSRKGWPEQIFLSASDDPGFDILPATKQLGYAACAWAGSLDVSGLSCKICDAKAPKAISDYSKIPISSWHNFRHLLSNANDQEIRISFLTSLQRVFRHGELKDYHLIENSLAKDCTRGLSSKLFQVRVAAGLLVPLFFPQGETKCDTATQNTVMANTLFIMREFKGLLEESSDTVWNTIFPTIGDLGRFASEDVLLHVLILLIEQLGIAKVLIRASAFHQIKNIAKFRKITTHQLISPYLPEISVYIIDRQNSTDILKEFAHLIGVDIKDFIENSLEYTLPFLIINEKREHISIITKHLKSEISVLCVSQIHNILTAIFMLESAHLTRAIRFLLELVNDSSITMPSLIRSSCLNLIRKIAVELGDDSDARRTKAKKALSSVIKMSEDDPHGTVTSSRESSDFEHLSEFLCTQFLGILSYINENIFDMKQKKRQADKIKITRSLNEIFCIIGPKIFPMMNQIITALQTILELPYLRDAALDAWMVFLKVLDIKNVGGILNQVTIILLKHLADYSADQLHRVVQIFEYLFVENSSSLSAHFFEIVSLPARPEFSKVRERIARARGGLKPTISDAIRMHVHNILQENPEITKGALSELRKVLEDNQKYVHAQILAETVGNEMVSAIKCLLDTCRRFNGTRDDILVLCCECLGIIGAADPARVQITMVPDRDIIPSGEFTPDFACSLIEKQLAPAFLSAQNTKVQDHISYAIQELLRNCGFTIDIVDADKRIFVRDKSKPGTLFDPALAEKGKLRALWDRFPKAVVQIIRPLLLSQYRANPPKQNPVTYPVFPSKSSFKDWLQTWAIDLIFNVQSKRSKGLFLVCKSVVENNANVALFILPHLVLNVLLWGKIDCRQSIVSEFLSVLNDTTKSDGPVDSAKIAEKRQLGCQTIFTLIDHLTLWIRWRRVDAIRRKADMARRSGKFIAADDVDDPDAQITLVEGVLHCIPHVLVAEASYRCKAYARALLHFEKHIRAESYHMDEVQTQPLYAYLQKIYAHLDESDGMDGIATKFITPTIEQQILEHESAGRWTAAQTCYEISMQENPDQLDAHIGLINCLKNQGHLETMLNHINGIVSAHPEWSATLNSYAIEAAWRLGSWSSLDKYVNSRHEITFETSIGKLLLCARKRDAEEFSNGLKSARERLIATLAAASMESYARGYDTVVRLHMLYELEMVFGNQFDTASCSSLYQPKKMPFAEMIRAWDSRLKMTLPSLKAREPILNLRRTLLRGLCSPSSEVDLEIGSLWIQTAKALRKAGHLEPAFNAILHAAGYKASNVGLEKAKLLTERNQTHKAIMELQATLKTYERLSPGNEAEHALSKDFISVARDGTLDTKSSSFLKAKTLLMLANRIEESSAMSVGNVAETYMAVVSTQNDWEKGHFYLGRYYARMLEEKVPGVTAYEVCRSYLKTLSFGTRFIYQALPRMLTLWLDFGTQLSRRPEAAESKNSGIFSKINNLMKRMIDKVPAYQLLTALPQLISRICHINRSAHAVLEQMIITVVKAYPHQALWNLVSVNKSRYHVRATRCAAIFDKIKSDQSLRQSNSSVAALVVEAMKLTDELLALCNYAIKGNETQLNMSRDFKNLKRMSSLQMILPIQSSLTVTLPSNNSTLSSHRPFPNEAPTFLSFFDDIDVMNSLQKPRKIKVLGSNSNEYNFLLKPKDDLRKDARLMEFNSLINKLLKRDAESRRRNLLVRTYAVVPLNEECGIIEWVENTNGFRNIVLKSYKAKNRYFPPQETKALLEQRGIDVAEVFKTKVLPKYPPVFHEWFLETFPEPTKWFNSRNSYAATVAVMSMVGYTVGLGDRHGENILFDELTGECVHVDLNCLFEKGTTFEKPEVVPFRLTHNMVDAFGVSGVEGVFRKSCEHTLRVLRANRDSLNAVLETFIHDPLCEWSKRSSHHQQNGTGETENEEAVKHLKTIDQKLRGVIRSGSPLSVEGQVAQLIAEATDARNLAVMYIGSNMALASLLPPKNFGMTTLNRELFKKKIDLVALRVPAASCNTAMQRLQGSLCDLPRVRSIVDDSNSGEASKTKGQTSSKRLVLLSPSITETNIEKMPEKVREFASSVGAEVTQYELELGYDYWTSDHILRSILPDELEVPGSFEMIGHIAHLNLRDQYLPYKKLIGEIILDKNKYIRTVVNKTDSIDHTFRFFKMELLAGDDDMMADMKEGSCRFKFDFSKVYWNSRLSTEHHRIISLFKPGEIICDVFAGVGPFAIPAAKTRNCTVFANDLNPASNKFLVENIELNKVAHKVRPYNMDGREFIRTALVELNRLDVIMEMEAATPKAKAPREKGKQTHMMENSEGLSKVDQEHSRTTAVDVDPAPRPFQYFNHYVMNLPATALSFLDAFRGILFGHDKEIPADCLPIVHCHCFTFKNDEASVMESEVVRQAESVLGTKIGLNLIGVHRVRNVSPKKEMMCISFRIPAEIAFALPDPIRGDQKRVAVDDAEVDREKKR